MVSRRLRGRIFGELCKCGRNQSETATHVSGDKMPSRKNYGSEWRIRVIK